MLVEIPLPTIGQRVQLRHDVDRFPECIVPKGSQGTVEEVSEEGRVIYVKLDDHVKGLEEWDNCLAWTDCGAHWNGFFMPFVLDFHDDCEFCKR